MNALLAGKGYADCLFDEAGSREVPKRWIVSHKLLHDISNLPSGYSCWNACNLREVNCVKRTGNITQTKPRRKICTLTTGFVNPAAVFQRHLCIGHAAHEYHCDDNNWFHLKSFNSMASILPRSTLGLQGLRNDLCFPMTAPSPRLPRTSDDRKFSLYVIMGEQIVKLQQEEGAVLFAAWTIRMPTVIRQDAAPYER